MPAVLIDRSGGRVVVDGRAASGLDLSALPAGLSRLVWTGSIGEAEIDGRTVPVADLDDLQGVLAAHAAKMAEIDAGGPGVDVASAVQRVLAAVDRHRQQLQDLHLAHNGRLYYADPDSLNTITTTMAIVQMMADTDPVPTPAPVAGGWLTADVDAQGRRVVQAMTCAEFRQLARALYDRNAALWGSRQIHYATVDAMAAAGATAEQLLGYDHTAGWPET